MEIEVICDDGCTMKLFVGENTTVSQVIQDILECKQIPSNNSFHQGYHMMVHINHRDQDQNLMKDILLSSSVTIGSVIRHYSKYSIQFKCHGFISIFDHPNHQMQFRDAMNHLIDIFFQASNKQNQISLNHSLSSISSYPAILNTSIPSTSNSASNGNNNNSNNSTSHSNSMDHPSQQSTPKQSVRKVGVNSRATKTQSKTFIPFENDEIDHPFISQTSSTIITTTRSQPIVDNSIPMELNKIKTSAITTTTKRKRSESFGSTISELISEASSSSPPSKRVATGSNTSSIDSIKTILTEDQRDTTNQSEQETNISENHVTTIIPIPTSTTTITISKSEPAIQMKETIDSSSSSDNTMSSSDSETSDSSSEDSSSEDSSSQEDSDSEEEESISSKQIELTSINNPSSMNTKPTIVTTTAVLTTVDSTSLYSTESEILQKPNPVTSQPLSIESEFIQDNISSKELSSSVGNVKTIMDIKSPSFLESESDSDSDSNSDTNTSELQSSSVSSSGSSSDSSSGVESDDDSSDNSSSSISSHSTSTSSTNSSGTSSNSKDDKDDEDDMSTVEELPSQLTDSQQKVIKEQTREKVNSVLLKSAPPALRNLLINKPVERSQSIQNQPLKRSVQQEQVFNMKKRLRDEESVQKRLIKVQKDLSSNSVDISPDPIRTRMRSKEFIVSSIESTPNKSKEHEETYWKSMDVLESDSKYSDEGIVQNKSNSKSTSQSSSQNSNDTTKKVIDRKPRLFKTTPLNTALLKKALVANDGEKDSVISSSQNSDSKTIPSQTKPMIRKPVNNTSKLAKGESKSTNLTNTVNRGNGTTTTRSNVTKRVKSN